VRFASASVSAFAKREARMALLQALLGALLLLIMMELIDPDPGCDDMER
jgi:hypothetical protein